MLIYSLNSYELGVLLDAFRKFNNWKELAEEYGDTARFAEYAEMARVLKKAHDYMTAARLTEDDGK